MKLQEAASNGKSVKALSKVADAWHNYENLYTARGMRDHEVDAEHIDRVGDALGNLISAYKQAGVRI
jgi:hypothetical protein